MFHYSNPGSACIEVGEVSKYLYFALMQKVVNSSSEMAPSLVVSMALNDLKKSFGLKKLPKSGAA